MTRRPRTHACSTTLVGLPMTSMPIGSAVVGEGVSASVALGGSERMVTCSGQQAEVVQVVENDIGLLSDLQGTKQMLLAWKNSDLSIAAPFEECTMNVPRALAPPSDAIST